LSRPRSARRSAPCRGLDDAYARRAGEEGAVEKSFQLLRRFVDGAGPMTFKLSRGGLVVAHGDGDATRSRALLRAAMWTSGSGRDHLRDVVAGHRNLHCAESDLEGVVVESAGLTSPVFPSERNFTVSPTATCGRYAAVPADRRGPRLCDGATTVDLNCSLNSRRKCAMRRSDSREAFCCDGAIFNRAYCLAHAYSNL